jgi:hypothetical protein
LSNSPRASQLSERDVAGRLGAAFALGAALGTALDALHAYGDVETYPHAELGRLGWFVPLEFGLAGVAATLAVPALERRFGPPRPPRWSLPERLLEVALIAGLYGLTVLGNGSPAPFVLAVLLIVLAIRLTLFSTTGDWAFALAGAVLGPAVEAILAAIGVFHYTEPDIAGVPMWLPAIWANGGLLVRRVFGPLAVPQQHEAA